MQEHSMEYNQIFRPDTLEKLNKRSQENLKKMMGDKTLMQTMMSSTRLLQEIMKIEAPYKDQLEQLAIQMVEDMYPIITEDGINIDAKIVSMGDVNKSLDEIKVNNPNFKLEIELLPLSKDSGEISEDSLKRLGLELRQGSYPNVFLFKNYLYYTPSYQNEEDIPEISRLLNSKGIKNDIVIWYGHPNIKISSKYYKVISNDLDEIKIDKPISLKFPIHIKNEEEYKIVSKKLSDLGYVFFRNKKPIGDKNLFKIYGNIINLNNGIVLKNPKDKLISWDRYDSLNESTPESKRRVINGITQGAALHGTFSFYMFKEYLDAIDDTLVEKYNQLMKEVFGVYDDDNAIAMFLQMIAQGQKMGGGSSKVVINEIKINKPVFITIEKIEDLLINLPKANPDIDGLDNYNATIKKNNDLIHRYQMLKSDIEFNRKVDDKSQQGLKDLYYDIMKYFSKNINEIKIEKPETLNQKKEREFEKLYKQLEEEYPELHAEILFRKAWSIIDKKYSLDESQQKSPTIQARAICFPMLVHEIIKGLYELVSLQGFQGNKEQNQQVVDKVDKIENEPHDLRYGKYIYEALNNIYADSGYDDPRIREFFFAEVYQLEDQEFVDFIENALNDELTPSQQSWIKQTLKEIQMDLRDDDFDATGLDEIKISNPTLKYYPEWLRNMRLYIDNRIKDDEWEYEPKKLLKLLIKKGFLRPEVEDDIIQSWRTGISNLDESKSPCWDDYKKQGTKIKNK